jgi:cellulose synthase/poly-beta-1,6-N-acetylglucosamine synthase-like glycosyltransferase
MASMSYWIISPNFILALIGKLRGWDPVTPTPSFDWRTAKVDVAIPAKNEERDIALALGSLAYQNFPLHRITVVDDGSTDRTAEVIRTFAEHSGLEVELIVRAQSVGKTPTLRELCQRSEADVLFVLDADTILIDRGYISACVQELFRNAGVACVSGKVMPLTNRRRNQHWSSSPSLGTICTRFGLRQRESWREKILLAPVIVYREALYTFLHGMLYDGQQKLIGNTLNPTGCAVAYKRDRLAECFAYAAQHVGDNMSTSEDIYIGHFFSWKGYRNVHISSVLCESTEPPVNRVWKQMFLWSSSFIQSFHYFPELSLTPVGWLRKLRGGGEKPGESSGRQQRHVQEQYRSAWGEKVTRRYGRAVGLLSIAAIIEKTAYPLILAFLCFWSPETAALTVAAEVALSTVVVMAVANSGSRWRSGALMLAATPLRLLSLFVDLYCMLRFCVDLATANRNWRK